jgi:hypothetical protein
MMTKTLRMLRTMTMTWRPLMLHKDPVTLPDRVVLVAQRALQMRVPPESVNLCLRHMGRV